MVDYRKSRQMLKPTREPRVQARCGGRWFFVDTSLDLVDSNSRSNAGYKWVKGRCFLRIGRFSQADAYAVGSFRGTGAARLHCITKDTPIGSASVIRGVRSAGGVLCRKGLCEVRNGLLALVTLLLTLPSCSQPTPGGEDSLRSAVDRFWEYRLAEDFAAMYDNSLSREAQAQYRSRDEFMKTKGGLRYHWYKIEEIHVEGDTGSAKVKYAWNHNFPEGSRPDLVAVANRAPFEEDADQKWLLEDGTWRLAPSRLNPMQPRE